MPGLAGGEEQPGADEGEADQPQAGAAESFGDGVVGLGEWFKNMGSIFWADPNSRILDG